MALIRCPDCNSDASDAAPQCPKCGRPIAGSLPSGTVPLKDKIDKAGAWCPNCGNRDSYKETKAGCFYWGIVLFLILLPLFFYPFLPRVWHCRVCRNEWRA